jgi:hypothetical protein
MATRCSMASNNCRSGQRLQREAFGQRNKSVERLTALYILTHRNCIISENSQHNIWFSRYIYIMHIRAIFLIIVVIIVGTDMQLCSSVMFVNMSSDLCVRECWLKEWYRYVGSCDKPVWTNSKFLAIKEFTRTYFLLTKFLYTLINTCSQILFKGIHSDIKNRNVHVLNIGNT